MNGLILLLKNLCYLSKFSLKTKFIRTGYFQYDYGELVENILYYMPDSAVIRPKILDKTQTTDLLVNSNLSLARFGDGELSIIAGNSIPYQKYDRELALKLSEILKNTNKNLLVGINHWYFYCKYNPALDEVTKHFEFESMPYFRKELLKHIDLNKEYCDAGINGIQKSFEGDYDKFKTIWNNREIIVVACKEAIEKTKYNIYDNAKQIDYIFVPNKNSYSEYNQTIEKIKNYNKNTLVILMCGPLSKVLASDLSNIGYRALDLGHLMKAYDYYRKGIKITSETVEEFYKPDEKADI